MRDHCFFKTRFFFMLETLLLPTFRRTFRLAFGVVSKVDVKFREASCSSAALKYPSWDALKHPLHLPLKKTTTTNKQTNKPLEGRCELNCFFAWIYLVYCFQILIKQRANTLEGDRSLYVVGFFNILHEINEYKGKCLFSNWSSKCHEV